MEWPETRSGIRNTADARRARRARPSQRAGASARRAASPLEEAPGSAATGSPRRSQRLAGRGRQVLPISKRTLFDADAGAQQTAEDQQREDTRDPGIGHH